jgi:hypothetical protein
VQDVRVLKIFCCDKRWSAEDASSAFLVVCAYIGKPEDAGYFIGCPLLGSE